MATLIFWSEEEKAKLKKQMTERCTPEFIDRLSLIIYKAYGSMAVEDEDDKLDIQKH